MCFGCDQLLTFKIFEHGQNALPVRDIFGALRLSIKRYGYRLSVVFSENYRGRNAPYHLILENYMTTEAIITQRIQSIRTKIEDWIKQQPDLGKGFCTPQLIDRTLYYKDKPEDLCIFVLTGWIADYACQDTLLIECCNNEYICKAFDDGEYNNLYKGDYVDCQRFYESRNGYLVIEYLNDFLVEHGFCAEEQDYQSKIHISYEGYERIAVEQEWQDYLIFRWVTDVCLSKSSPLSESLFSEIYLTIARNSQELPGEFWESFEEFSGDIFRSNQYIVEKSPKSYGGDGGVDRILYLSDKKGKKPILVQVKNLTKKVGPNYLRELLGVAAAWHEPVLGCIFFSATSYTNAARGFVKAANANGWNFNIWGPDELPDLVKAVEMRIRKRIHSIESDKERIQTLLNKKGKSEVLEGQVFCASESLVDGLVTNFFVLVLESTQDSAVLLNLEAIHVPSEQKFFFAGYEIPNFDITQFNKINTFIALKAIEDDHVIFYDRGKCYSRWDGTPQWWDRSR